MQLAEPPATPGSSPQTGKKRPRGRPKGSRGRKKQKRLDAIQDTPDAAPSPVPQSPGDDGTLIRRSSRVRRAPAFLDSSPAPPRQRKRRRLRDSPSKTGSGDGGGRRGRKVRRRADADGREEGDPDRIQADDAPSSSRAQDTKVSEEEIEDWRSRLRTRVGKRIGRTLYIGVGAERRGKRSVKQVYSQNRLQPLPKETIMRGRRKILCDEVDMIAEETGQQEETVPSDDQGDGGESPSHEVPSHEVDHKNFTDLQAFVEPEKEIEVPLPPEEIQENTVCTDGNEKENFEQSEDGKVILDQQPVNVSPGANATIPISEHEDGKPLEAEATTKDILEEGNLKQFFADEKSARKHIKEGRRCGLCGGGTDGRPPKKLINEYSGSDNEAYEGSSASEEPNYDIWDGFGDEPEWLGRLLGPINDRFGIPRVWVHQHCAVWSPEVYFAGLGCLKNVRAALCRGRALKCSRCGRPGATIGCRVDRCPKTYHLPCSRAEGCIFDHLKFLIACHDHRHLFQPHGDECAKQVKKLKLKKLKLSMRRVSHDAWRKDLEDEEKWLENCGEDEEFLKREGRRLHRDLLRIAPTYIGGSSENEKKFEGWESVAGLQDVINCLKEVVILPLLYPEVFSTLGLTPPRGVLLHGYPGTGKTLVVRALIGACSRGDNRIAYFARKGADCLGKYVGDAERQLRLLFQVAERSQPSIIFFDEIDGLAPCRSRHQDQTHNSVVSTLLSLLDGLKSRGSVIVIGATNRPDAVDPALRRPGRFDREIYFPLPKLKDRSAILSLHTKGWPNPVSGPLLSWIANQTAGYAGADLQALCTQAAMNALKRNCALQELLTSAEKWSNDGKLPSLPSFMVEERDWLAALAAAPPPCSRREAGMAANDIVSSPLRSHLIACLLKPLSELLIEFYIDERIWLPPAFLKASLSIKRAIISALEHESVPTGFWWSHFHSLINKPPVANEVERILCRYGLVTGQSGCDLSCILDNDLEDCKNFDSNRSKPSNFCVSGISKLKYAELGKSSGYHVLIAGTPRSGQQHVASSLLHGFSGHLEIQKINLATMSQEGHGDIVRGLTQTLLKCLNGGRCMIYMPRIDLWAIETCRKEAVHTDTDLETCAISTLDDVTLTASEAWNLFIEQVDSVAAPSSVIIMATCEMQPHDLPLAIRKFFTNDVPDGAGSIPLQHTVPRFSVNIDGSFSHNLLISSCAAKLSEDLAQHYITLMHHCSHMDNCSNETLQMLEPYSVPQAQPTEERHNNQMDSQNIASPGEASQMDIHKMQHVGNDQSISLPSMLRGHDNSDVKHHTHQDSISKTLNKGVKGGSMLAIATFGYQILRYPHFSELCWVTSKLKEGPSADINGPWKHWPFNSCAVNTCSSPEKIVSGVNINSKDRELSGTVRGLVAVGLLAYHGMYTSVREVSSEVRKVLELLVGQIRERVSGRKDKLRYFRILSQVAYLEDIVNSWAYTFRSLPAEIRKAVENPKPTTLEDMPLDVQSNKSPIVENGLSGSAVPDCNEPQNMSTGDLIEALKGAECNNLIKGSESQSLSNSDVCAVEKGQRFTSASYPSDFPSSEAASGVPNGTETNGSDNQIMKNVDTEDHYHALQIREASTLSLHNICNVDVLKEMNSCSTKITNHCDVSENVSISENIIGEPDLTTNMVHERSSSLSVAPNVLCLYHCCYNCLQNLCALVGRILSDSLRSSSHCSRVDDMHDILASCSLKMLAIIRRCYYSPNGSANAKHFQREQQHEIIQSEHCACPNDSDKQLQEIGFVPTECVYHLRHGSEIATTNFETDSLTPDLKFFFKDGVLMPADPHMDILPHCRFDKLCLSFVVQMILMNKQQLG